MVCDAPIQHRPYTCSEAIAKSGGYTTIEYPIVFLKIGFLARMLVVIAVVVRRWRRMWPCF
jgi:hypothetical protein